MLDESDRLRRNRRLEANPVLPVDANLDVARRIDTAVNFALGARLEGQVLKMVRAGLGALLLKAPGEIRRQWTSSCCSTDLPAPNGNRW